MGEKFLKTIAIAMFSLFAISCCHKQNMGFLHYSSARKVIAKDAVVFITVNTITVKKNAQSSGTGVAVKRAGDKTLILTAGHICIDLIDPELIIGEILVIDIDGNGYHSEIQSISKNFDLCLLSIRKQMPTASISKQEPKSGDRVGYSGYPTGLYMPGLLHHFDGYMAGKDPMGDHIYNIPVVGGSSGSPIYNKKGEIVGIVSAVMEDFNYMTIAVGTKNVRDFMAENGY